MNRMHFLLVEDLPEDAELARRQIDKLGFPVEYHFVDRRDSYLTELATREPDLIISDYALPSFSGMDALALARERYPLVPFVILTGSINEEVAVECMKAGADDYVLKENIPRLGAAVQTALRNGTLRREKAVAEEKLRLALAEKDTLLKEIHHRVKNNLQVVSGLLAMQAQHNEDPRFQEAVGESQNRILAMARIHEKLYQSSSLAHVAFDAYLRDLARQLMTVYRVTPGQVRLQEEMESLLLPIHLAMPLALIANELIANTFKHAFPDGRSGTVRISLQRIGEEPPQARLEIGDDGVGLPPNLEPAHPTSLGFSLVRLLTGQIHARLDIQPGPPNSFRIDFAL